MKPIRVLIVDDSAVVRMVLKEILSSDPTIQVVGSAEDPFEARDKIKTLKPDVLTLDIEMPKMDGVQFLEKIMRLRPMPVIMVSTLTKQGAEISLRALELGAVDLVHKPGQDAHHIEALAKELLQKVKMAAKANLAARDIEVRATQNSACTISTDIVAIGASTGGTEAIKDALKGYPADGPPVVITQHIPPVFSTTYSLRLSKSVGLPVTEVIETVELKNGNLYLAQGDRHLVVKSKGGKYFATPDNGDKVNKHRPAVDVMFNSLIPIFKKNVVAVVLTGMGADGAEGLLGLKQAGAHTIAQDEATSVVWGMPKRAIELGGVKEILSLSNIQAQLRKISCK